MNKKQLKVLGALILIISLLILIAPKYVYVPYRGTLLLSKFPELANKYETKISWNWVLQFSLPIILISGFLIYILREPIKFPKIPKAFVTFLKYTIIVTISLVSILATIIGIAYIRYVQETNFKSSFIPDKPSGGLNLDLLPDKPSSGLNLDLLPDKPTSLPTNTTSKTDIFDQITQPTEELFGTQTSAPSTITTEELFGKPKPSLFQSIAQKVTPTIKEFTPGMLTDRLFFPITHPALFSIAHSKFLIMAGLLIIGGFLIYTLRNKKK